MVGGEPQFLDERRDTLLNPELIVEVLSPSTEAYDRGRKFEHYKALPSFREYLLLASDRMHADLCIRQPDNRWLLVSADAPDEWLNTRHEDDTLTLDSMGARLRLADLYAKVEFAA